MAVRFVVCLLAAAALAACNGAGPASATNAEDVTTHVGAPVQLDAGGWRRGGLLLQPNIAAEVPDSIRRKGVLEVGVDATYPPNEFIDPRSGQLRGWDIELGNAIAKVIGVPFKFHDTNFNTIIPNVGTLYDLGISSFTPTAYGEETVDFVTYYQAGESWFVKAGGPPIGSVADMCGKAVAVQHFTLEESDAWGFLGKDANGSPIFGDRNNCKAAHKPDFSVYSFDTQADVDADVLSGHSDIGWFDEPVTDYQVKLSNGQLQVSGKPCSVAPYGIALPKGSGLETALQDAIKYLIDSGYYATILESWNVQDGAITSSAVTLNDNDRVGASCVPAY